MSTIFKWSLLTNLIVLTTLTWGREICMENPQLKLAHIIKNNLRVSLLSCESSCPNFVPQISLIPCDTAQQCDQFRLCLDKEYRDENKNNCWKETMEGSPTLEYEIYRLNGLVKCRDQNNHHLQTTDYILEPLYIPGRVADREQLLQGRKSELITITPLDDGGPLGAIYENGVRVFYKDSEVKVYATPSRFFFRGKCDWILRSHGSAIDLYNQDKDDTVLARETIKFRAGENSNGIICSIKWYNSSTERLETQLPFKIIEPLQATSPPRIEMPTKMMKLSFDKTEKIICKYSGGNGHTTWFSKLGVFQNETNDSYKILQGSLIEGVKEVKYLFKKFNNTIIEDLVTCVVRNELGSKSHSIRVQVFHQGDPLGRTGSGSGRSGGLYVSLIILISLMIL